MRELPRLQRDTSSCMASTYQGAYCKQEGIFISRSFAGENRSKQANLRGSVDVGALQAPVAYIFTNTPLISEAQVTLLALYCWPPLQHMAKSPK